MRQLEISLFWTKTPYDKLLRVLFLVGLLWGIVSLACAADTLTVGAFSTLDPEQGLPLGWQKLIFPRIVNHTQYRLIHMNGKTVLQARSKAAASGLIRPIAVNPRQYPWLAWSWRVQNILKKGNATSKQGDDYPARIYVAFAFESGKAGLWERLRHKTASLAAGRELPGSVLNYIWASHAPVDLFVNNPYTSRAKMIVVRSGARNLNRWINERRNIPTDYKKAFGKEPPAIIGVAVMTDTDNTGEEAVAYYGDIVLSSD